MRVTGDLAIITNNVVFATDPKCFQEHFFYNNYCRFTEIFWNHLYILKQPLTFTCITIHIFFLIIQVVGILALEVSVVFNNNNNDNNNNNVCQITGEIDID